MNHYLFAGSECGLLLGKLLRGQTHQVQKQQRRAESLHVCRAFAQKKVTSTPRTRRQHKRKDVRSLELVSGAHLQ